MKSVPDFMKSARESIKSTSNLMKSASDLMKSAMDSIKSTSDLMKSARESIKSTSDSIKSATDLIKSLPDFVSSGPCPVSKVSKVATRSLRGCSRRLRPVAFFFAWPVSRLVRLAGPDFRLVEK